MDSAAANDRRPAAVLNGRFIVTILFGSALGGSVVASTPPVVATGSTGCPARGTTVLENESARLYFESRRSGERQLRGCAFAVGRPRTIGGSVFPPPAVDLDGTLVAFAFRPTDAGEELGYVVIKDLTTGSEVVTTLFDNANRIGSLRLRAPDSIAYISCSLLDVTPDVPDEAPAPRECSSSGSSEKQVIVRPSGGTARLVARGRRIAATSLRQAGPVISWTERGRRVRTTFGNASGDR